LMTPGIAQSGNFVDVYTQFGGCRQGAIGVYR
jgi:hypothetical protein